MPPEPTIMTEDISDPNTKWGICGFASSIGALYENHVIKTTILKKDMETRLLAEIKTYLRMLQAEGGSTMLAQIQAFTRTFKGFEQFSIDRYIELISSAPDDLSPDFSMAMPANGVVDYLRRMHGLKNARLVPPGQKANNVILGLVDNSWSSWLWGCGGLKHWVYKKNDLQVYNWGHVKSLTDVIAEVGVSTIGYQVALF